MPDSYTDKCRGGEVGRVHRHRRVALPTAIRVVSYATTALAPIVVANPLVPGILREAMLRSFNRNGGRLVVRPERAVATADRTIAARHRAGQLPDMKSNRPAVAGGDGHGSVVEQVLSPRAAQIGTELPTPWKPPTERPALGKTPLMLGGRHRMLQAVQRQPWHTVRL